MPNTDKEEIDASDDDTTTTQSTYSNSPLQSQDPPSDSPTIYIDDDEKQETVHNSKPKKARYGPPKNSKMTQHPLEFKMQIFKALESVNISYDDLISENDEVQKRIKVPLETIIHTHFTDRYPTHTVNGRLKPRKVTRIKYMIKGWENPNQKTNVKLNYISAPKGAVRCGGGGKKNELDPDTQLAIFKYINSVLDSFSLSELHSAFVEVLSRSPIYTVDPNDPNPQLKYYEVTDRRLRNFKRTWNLITSSHSKTSYDIDDVAIAHLLSVCRCLVLRRCFKEKIDYVGHQDQMMTWHSLDVGRVYTTSFNHSNSGQRSRQNARKTFTSIPTIYHNLSSDTVDFGPVITIFDSKSKEMAPKFVKSLKSVGLANGFNRDHSNFCDISSNGWQQSRNMKVRFVFCEHVDILQNFQILVKMLTSC